MSIKNESNDRLQQAIQILNNAIAERQIERDKMAKQLGALDQQQDNSRELLAQYQEELNLRKYQNHTLDVDWAKLMEPDPWFGNDTFRKKLIELMDGRIGLDWSGIDATTEGYAFRISINRDDVSQSYLLLLKNALLTILPHIKPYEDGKKRLRLMEPSLSEFGVYNIFELNGKWSLTYGNRYTPRFSTENLDEFLAYLANNFAMHYGD